LFIASYYYVLILFPAFILLLLYFIKFVIYFLNL